MAKHAWWLLGTAILLACLAAILAMTDPIGIRRLDRAQRTLESKLSPGISIDEARRALNESGIRYSESDVKESSDKVIEGQSFSQRVGDKILHGRKSAGGVPCTDNLALTLSFSSDGKLRSRFIHRYYHDCV